jgi:hypothetical protein
MIQRYLAIAQSKGMTMKHSHYNGDNHAAFKAAYKAAYKTPKATCKAYSIIAKE